MKKSRWGTKNKLTVKRVKRLRNKGKKRADIARKMGVSRAAVGQFMKRHGIT